MNFISGLRGCQGCILSVIKLYLRKQNWNLLIFVISGNQTFINQIYGIVGSLGLAG